jgi:hypothetical protein
LQADIFWSAILLLYKNVCVGFAAWILTLAVGSFKFWSAFLPYYVHQIASIINVSPLVLSACFETAHFSDYGGT